MGVGGGAVWLAEAGRAWDDREEGLLLCGGIHARDLLFRLGVAQGRDVMHFVCVEREQSIRERSVVRLPLLRIDKLGMLRKCASAREQASDSWAVASAFALATPPVMRVATTYQFIQDSLDETERLVHQRITQRGFGESLCSNHRQVLHHAVPSRGQLLVHDSDLAAKRGNRHSI